jgi:hypothetical protein
MTIEIGQESILTLQEAAKLLPRRRAGRKPHVSTLYRWASRGLKGAVLETVQVGGTTCTSREALQRFFDKLQRSPRLMIHESPREINTRIADAESLLRDAGFITE